VVPGSAAWQLLQVVAESGLLVWHAGQICAMLKSFLR
jgi:hypothetical protein